MQVLKCKMCGGDLVEAIGESKIVECEYCGLKQTIPSFSDDKKIALYNRANKLRINSEFDKAATIYEQIINDFPEEAEAYWCLCLCNYGIEYVDDKISGTKIPTMHRSSYDMLRKDSNYELALEYADAEAKLLYQEEAKEIDRIRSEMLSISKNEEPYDIFICYKETDNKGNRTPDSVLAQEIYDELTEKGFKVFFSRITLEDKLGQQYEPYIFAALNTARIMLVVGTDYEYLDSVWVKNEWSRFLKLMAKDKKKVLIPCYKDIDPYDLPDDFKYLQAQDCSKLGFMQDLVRGIKKIFNNDNVIKNENSNSLRSTIQQIDSLLTRVFMFLEDRDWESADRYCEKILDIEPKNGKAYLGKLLAKFKIDYNNLKNGDFDLDVLSDNLYVKAKKFADEELREVLDSTVIKKREKENRYKELYDQLISIGASFKRKQIDDIENELKTVNDKILAKEILDACNKNIERLIENKKKVLTKIESLSNKLNSLESMLNYKDRFLTKSEIEKENSELTKIENALTNNKTALLTITTKGVPEDSIDSLYREKEKLLLEKSDLQKKHTEGFILQANDIITEISDSPFWLNKIKEDKEIAPLLKTCMLIEKVRSSEIGSTINFGMHKFSNMSYRKEEIEWIIIDKDDSKALLISKYALDCKQYNRNNNNPTWKDCDLRLWLNQTFYNEAFNSYEKSLISNSEIAISQNKNNEDASISEMADKIFLLNSEEADKYFDSPIKRQCKTTPYAKSSGVDTHNDFCWWWLRSCCNNDEYVSGVDYDGYIDSIGKEPRGDCFGVRPALWINIGH